MDLVRTGPPPDICSTCGGDGAVFRVQDGRAVDVRREAFRVSSLTSFGEDAAGELYFATGNGRIFKLAR